MSGCPFHRIIPKKGRVSSVAADLPARALSAKRVSVFRLAFQLVRARFHFIRAIQQLFALTGCDTIRVPVLGTDMYISAEPRLCHDILVERADDYGKTRWEHRVLSPVMEDGLIILEGERWKKRRKASATCFGSRFIESLAGILFEVSSARLAGWSRTVSLDHEFGCMITESMTRFFSERVLSSKAGESSPFRENGRGRIRSIHRANRKGTRDTRL